MPTLPTSFHVVIDCGDPERVATFWAGALGYRIQDPLPPGEDSAHSAAVIDPEGMRPRISFQRVGEAKVVKNRVHLDLNVSGGYSIPAAERRRRIDAEVDRVRRLGATVLRPVEQWDEYWVVMADPEGNEFCVQ